MARDTENKAAGRLLGHGRSQLPQARGSQRWLHIGTTQGALPRPHPGSFKLSRACGSGSDASKCSLGDSVFVDTFIETSYLYQIIHSLIVVVFSIFTESCN